MLSPLQRLPSSFDAANQGMSFARSLFVLRESAVGEKYSSLSVDGDYSEAVWV